MKTTPAQKRASKKWYGKNKDKVKKDVLCWSQQNPRHILFTKAKQRAKENQLEFNLELDDIVLPEVCPYTGLKLQKSIGKICNESYSLDRIDPSKGYVKGNIEVISYLANRAKSNMTVTQLRAFAAEINRRYNYQPSVWMHTFYRG